MKDPKDILLQLIASLTLADHMGDVSNEIQKALEQLGETPEWDDFPELQKWLHAKGITTLYGTSIGDDDE